MITKNEAKKLLSIVPEHNAFRCCDGRVVRSVRDLGKTLAHMADDTFTYHANSNKNDFSNWIKDVIGDEKLARHLSRTSDRRQTLRELSDRITYLSGQLSSN